MLLNTHIGMDEEDGMGVDSAVFQRELLYLDSLGKKRIQLWINSIGGSIVEGYNIASAVLKTKTPVDTYNVGLAASMAGVIFMCGRERYMMDYALFMTHPPQGSSNGNIKSFLQDSLTTLLSAKSDISKEMVNQMMLLDTFLNATSCKEKGFCTEIENTNENNLKEETNHFSIFREANKITNSLLINKKPQMLKVTNKLGLNEGSSEEVVLDAISKMENRFNAEKEGFKTALESIKEEKNALEIEVEALKDTATIEKCTNLIKEFAKDGKIKDEEDTIEKWVNFAKIDFEGTKSVLEGLPINKVANKIEIIETEALPKKSYLAEKLSEITNKNKK
jgi:ATP-dependent Clp protease protease subunit